VKLSKYTTEWQTWYAMDNFEVEKSAQKSAQNLRIIHENGAQNSDKPRLNTSYV